MSDRKAMVQATFDAVAQDYDNVGVDFFRPIAEQLVSGLDLSTGESLLDIGCGKGAVLVAAGRFIAPDGHALGVDIAPRMVEAARAATVELPVDVIVGDAEAPDVGDRRFDVVTSSLVLFFLPEPARALRAWHELLVDGGRIGITTFGDYSSEWRAVDAVFQPYLPPQFRDARTSGATGPFESDAGVEGLLRDAGYVDLRTTTSTVSVRFEDEEHWRRWSLSTGQRALWELIPPDKRDGVAAEAYQRLQQTRDGDGRIGFDQVVRYTFGRRAPSQ